MKKILLLILTIILVFAGFKTIHNESSAVKKTRLNPEKIKDKAEQAFEYCKQKNLNQNFCILIDMEIHSGLFRMFVFDFNTKTIKHKMLVSHGCCDNPWSFDFSKENPKFSNIDGSHCSSLGKYKIGKRGYSNWGIHINYALHGLEETNNNAFSRFVVLHSWEEISDNEVHPKGTPEGWGCPSVSNSNMKLLDRLLKKTEKSVLLWIYK